MTGHRELDVVVFGATGATGRLVAEHLAAHAPSGCRWGIGGRDEQRLRAVRDRLAAQDDALEELPLLLADSDDDDSLRRMAERTRVVATTVGPFLAHGAGLVAACAATGTDYVDITGEPEFVDRVFLDHHAAARATGARLVHAAGFESVPPDIGVLVTVRQLPAGVPIHVDGIVRASGRLPSGTVRSAVLQLSRPASRRRTARERARLEPGLVGRRVRAVKGRPHRDGATGRWLVPLPTIDALVVRRTADALASYGPDFSYSHWLGVRSLPRALGAGAGILAVALGARLPPVRRLVLTRLPVSQGPLPEQRADAWFAVDLVGRGGGQEARARVTGGDPGYAATAAMLAESALCLAFDEDNPPTAGQVTPVAAMGDRLLDRLPRVGIAVVVDGPMPDRPRPVP